MDPLLEALKRQGLKRAEPAPARKASPAKAPPAPGAPSGRTQALRGVAAYLAKWRELHRAGQVKALGIDRAVEICNAAERAAWGER